MPSLLVIGTHNAKKGRELESLLSPYRFEVRTLADYPNAIDVVEDGDSFADNANRKASHQAGHLDRWVLGEDSGLVVDALDGAPGIYSARYSGEGATDESNNQKLLDDLRDVPRPRRAARYVCHASVADPSGRIRIESEASCVGRIVFQPIGESGFGYDPLFEIVEYHRTFAQLGDHVKSILSHRARAMRRLLPKLLPLRDSGQWA